MIKRTQHSKQLRVLIVDDSRFIRDILISLCSSMPRLEVVGEAANGLEAIAAIRKLKPDVVTLDIRMPRLSGIEVLKAMKAEGIDSLVIVLSSSTDEIYLKKGLDLGAKYVFDKGTELDKAIEVLRRL
jgi:two-component system, chemotaxis family, protein-glutamate methylesterase/glutaminase